MRTRRTRWRTGRRMRSLTAWLTAMLVFALLLPLAPARSAEANIGQWLWWSQEGNSYRTFGPNAAITIDTGRMVYWDACLRGFPDTFGIPWTDIYIVPSGSVGLGTELQDVGGSANTVQGTGVSAVFIGETIGYTGPGGQIPPGTYAVVYDECQDGHFDLEDALFDPAFEVLPPTSNVPDLPAYVQQLKEKAGQMHDLMKEFYPDIERWFNSHNRGSRPPRQYTWGLSNLHMLTNPMEAAKLQIQQKMNYYKSIKDDPPDPAFQQVTTVGDRAPIDPQTDDATMAAAIRYGSEAGNEQRLAEALLHALERYQGADQANNGDWALLHAWAIQDYSNALAIQANRSAGALADLAAELQADPRPYDAWAAEIQAFRDRVAAQGFTAEELREARDLGLSDAQIEDARQKLLAQNFAVTLAKLQADMAALQAKEAELSTVLQTFWNAMQTNVTQLQNDPSVSVWAPLANAGGPYSGTEGSPVSLNGSGSQSPSAITRYEWDFDNDGLFDDALGATPTHTFTQAFRGYVGLKVTNQAGHSNVAYAPVTVNNVNSRPYFASFAPGLSTEAIVGSSRTFTVSTADPDGDQVSVAWELDGASVGTGSAFAFSPGASQVGIHALEAVATDNHVLGGVNRLRWTVSVLMPDLDADGWRANTDCDDTDAMVNPGRPEAPGNGKDDDCDGTIDEGTPPLVYAPAGQQNANEGESAAFDLGALAALGAGPYTVVIDWGDGLNESFAAGAAGALGARTHTYGDNGTYTVSVSVSDGSGNSSSGSFGANVQNVAPQAAFQHPASVRAGQAVTLALAGATDPSAADTAAGFTYAFDCGAGYGPFDAAGTASCPTTAEGSLTVGARVRDKDGGTQTYTGTVAVTAAARPPRAFFQPVSSGRNMAASEAGATIHSSSGQRSTSYSPDRMINWATSDNYWATPQGQTSGWVKIDLPGEAPWLLDRFFITPANSSTERVKDFEVAVSAGTAADADFTTVLTGTAAANSNAQEFALPEPVLARYVLYRPLNNRGSSCCVSTAQFRAMSGQQGGPAVTFQNRSTDPDGDIVSYAWDFGDGSTSAEASPVHTYAGPGTYQVSLTVTDAEGATDTFTLTQKVLTPPSVSFTHPATMQEGAAYTFTDTSTDADGAIVQRTFSWGDGGETTPTGNAASHAFVDNQSYTVTLTVTDDQGQTASAQHLITPLNVAPTASAGSQLRTRWGVPTRPLNSAASDPSTVDRVSLQCLWNFGDGSTLGPGPCSDATNVLRPEHTFATPGTYTLRLTVTDKDGASHSSTTTAIIDKRGSNVAYQGPRTASAGGPVTLQAKLRDLETNGGASGRTITFTVAGQTLTGTTDGAGVASVSLNLAAGDYPVRVDFAGDDSYTAGWDLDRLLVDVADDALVTGGARLSVGELLCQDATAVTLQVTGTTPSTRNVPLDVALVIDKSGSMGTARMNAAKNAARNFVTIVDRESDGAQNGLIRGSRITSVPFEGSAWVGVPLSSDAAVLNAHIGSLTAGGGTAIHAGIQVGQAELLAGAKPGNKRVLILLSDGGSSFTAAKQAADAAKAAGTEIFSIGVGTGSDQTVLREIASEPKDTHYFFTADESQLEQIYQAIAESATGPAATDVVVTARVDPAFALDAASITPAPSTVSGNTITWTIPVLKGETRTFSYQATHQPGTGGGTKPIHQAATLAYTDTRGQRQTTDFPALTAHVTCPSALLYQGAVQGVEGQQASLAARLGAADGGHALAGQTVTFAIGGQTFAGQTDASGIARVSPVLNLAPGIYPLTVSFAGSADYTASQVTVQFEVQAGGPCEAVGWKAPLSSSATATLSASAPTMLRFSYNGCTDFVHDESVIMLVNRPGEEFPVTAWVYGSDIVIDDAAREYRVEFDPRLYSLPEGTDLVIDVFIGDQLVGRAAVRLGP